MRQPARQLIRHLIKDDSGQDLIEYALLTGFVTLTVVITATNLGQAIDGIFNDIEVEVSQIPTS